MTDDHRLGVGPYSRALVRALGLLYIGGPSVAVVTAVVYFDHEASSYYAYFYLWVTPYAALFFSAPHVAAHLLYPAVAYATVLAVHAGDGHPSPGGAQAGEWLHVMGALAVTVLLVRALSRALRENMDAIEVERRRRAMEINDDVVQRLVIARQQYADGEREQADASVEVALDRARRIMAELIETGGATPGSLRRDRPATLD